MITFLKAADSPPRSCPDQCARKRHKKILRPLAKPLLLSRRAFQELSGLSVSGRCGLETRNSTASLEPIACIGCIGLSLNLRGKFSMLSIWHPYGLIPVGNWTLLQLFISHLDSSTSLADYSLPPLSAASEREAALGAAVARIIGTLKTLKRRLRRQRIFRRLWTAGSFLQTDEAEELRQVVSTANLRRELWAFLALFCTTGRNINHGMSGYVGICRDLTQSWVCF